MLKNLTYGFSNGAEYCIKYYTLKIKFVNPQL